jgi:biopolymer transport protein ExbB/TolQ
MYAITAVMAFSLAAVLERSWLMWCTWSTDEAKASKLFRENALTDGLEASGTLGAVVLSEAVARPSPDKAQEAMAVGAVRAEAMLYKRLGLLAASANVATMLGLLGTVYGLIVAFSALGDGAAGQAANSLSEGISMAMSTTAWGLMVAIPTTAAHAILEARAEQLLASVEVMAGELILSKRD